MSSPPTITHRAFERTNGTGPSAPEVTGHATPPSVGEAFVPRPEDLGIGLLFWHMRDAAVVGEAGSGRIALWNPAAEVLFGYPAAEAVGQPLEMLVPDALRNRHRDGIARFAATGRGPLVEADQPVEVPALRKGGEEIAVELVLTPIVQDRVPGRFVLALIRDATERRRLERERTAVLAAAQEHAARLEDLARLKTDFSAMVAHELATPVAAIRALARLLADGLVPLAEQARLLGVVAAEADLVAGLVADVREAATVERTDFDVRPRPIPVAALVADAAAFAESLPGDHPLAVEVEGAAVVQADPERIAQVLRNLLGNAAKYTPPGTPVVLRAACVGDRVRIEVADRGPGIRSEERDRIFEKFGRGRDTEGNTVQGSGLGLYISRRLIRAHGTELDLTSTPGEGCVFGFSLATAS